MAHSEKPGHATRRSAPLDRAQRWHPGVQRGDNPDVALSVDPGHVGIGEDMFLADDGIPHHVRSLAPAGASAESQVAVVRLRRMEISDWRFGYAEWKSQVDVAATPNGNPRLRAAATSNGGVPPGSLRQPARRWMNPKQPPRVRFGKSRSSSGTYAW